VKHTRSDGVFYGPTVLEHARVLGLDLPVSGCVPFGAEPEEPRVAATVFGRMPQQENFLLARAWWRARGWSDEQLVDAACSFRVGEHRLARVGEVRGVGFWNDSKATNFHAVEAAVASFDAPVLWIGGGRSKGGDLAGFAARLAPHVRHAWLIGETREALAEHLREQAVPFALCADLRSAVTQAFAAAAAGDEILLSPGFASFDMFAGYADRGRHFEAIVAELAGSPLAGSRPSSQSPNPTPTRPVSAGLCLL
jgi:UDP-N-acetylmuramoylalanine--D-glutamate ligase